MRNHFMIVLSLRRLICISADSFVSWVGILLPTQFIEDESTNKELNGFMRDVIFHKF